MPASKLFAFTDVNPIAGPVDPGAMGNALQIERVFGHARFEELWHYVWAEFHHVSPMTPCAH